SAAAGQEDSRSRLKPVVHRPDQLSGGDAPASPARAEGTATPIPRVVALPSRMVEREVIMAARLDITPVAAFVPTVAQVAADNVSLRRAGGTAAAGGL